MHTERKYDKTVNGKVWNRKSNRSKGQLKDRNGIGGKGGLQNASWRGKRIYQGIGTEMD